VQLKDYQDNPENLSRLVADVRAKVPGIQRFDQEIFRLRNEVRRLNRLIDRARAGIGDESPEQLRVKLTQAEAHLRQSFSGRAAILSSIPFSDYPSVQRVINGLIGSVPGDPATDMTGRLVEAQLAARPPPGESVRDENRVRDLLKAGLSELAHAVRTDRERLTRVAARQAGEAPLSSAEQRALANDPALIQALLSRLPERRADLEGLACRIDARYGSGAEKLELTLMAGSLALSAGSGVVLKAASVGGRALAGGSLAARARGLISLRSARVLQAAALGLDSASAVHAIENACGRQLQVRTGRPESPVATPPPGQGVGRQNSCESGSAVKALDRDNCFLAAALSSLSFGAATAFSYQETRALWANRRTPATSPSDGLSGPELIQPAAVGKSPAETKLEEVVQALDGRAGAPRSVLSRFPSTVAQDLPDDYLAALRSEPRFERLQQEYRHGRGLTIHIPNYSPEREMAGRFGGLSGEDIQAHFMARVVKELLPEAEIRGGHIRSGPSGQIELKIVDAAESGDLGSRGAQLGRDLQMFDIKMANPGGIRLNRDDVRQALGLTDQHRVVSLNNSFYNRRESVFGLVDQVFKGAPREGAVVILSRGSAFGDIEVDALTRSFPRAVILKLSQLDGRPLPADRQVILINNTKGQMNAVYAASDLNVAAGAINMSEPIRQRTPTLFFSAVDEAGAHMPYLHDYAPAVYERMARVAEATGGAQRVESARDLSQAVRQALERPPRAQLEPYLASDPDSGVTPISGMLRGLERALDHGTDRSGLRVNVPRSLARETEVVSEEVEFLNRQTSAWRRIRETPGNQVTHAQVPRQGYDSRFGRGTILVLREENRSRLREAGDAFWAQLATSARSSRESERLEAIERMISLDRTLRSRFGTIVAHERTGRQAGLRDDTIKVLQEVLLRHPELESNIRLHVGSDSLIDSLRVRSDQRQTTTQPLLSPRRQSPQVPEAGSP
jgi:hypothetical protein